MTDDVCFDFRIWGGKAPGLKVAELHRWEQGPSWLSPLLFLFFVLFSKRQGCNEAVWQEGASLSHKHINKQTLFFFVCCIKLRCLKGSRDTELSTICVQAGRFSTLDWFFTWCLCVLVDRQTKEVCKIMIKRLSAATVLTTYNVTFQTVCLYFLVHHHRICNRPRSLDTCPKVRYDW